MYPDVLVSNQSTWDHDAVQRAVAAWQRQIVLDFAPIWGVSGVLHFVKDRPLADGEWGLTITDQSAADYLGEHHLEDVPRGVVLLGACKKFGESPEEVGSHEIVELFGDPEANICVELDDGTMEALEASDAVQGTGYEIDGVKVANFVTRLGYFCGKGSRYDFRSALTAPHSRTPGGYRLIKPPGGDWTQDVAGALATARKPPRWSRRGRRAARSGRKEIL
jgi:hypothetical protein